MFENPNTGALCMHKEFNRESGGGRRNQTEGQTGRRGNIGRTSTERTGQEYTEKHKPISEQTEQEHSQPLPMRTEISILALHPHTREGGKGSRGKEWKMVQEIWEDR